MKIRSCLYVVLCLWMFIAQPCAAQTKKEPIPHGQIAPPGPALSPLEAIKKMKVPPGFHVELVAAEPEIVNPVAMTFDERGRIWITESIEYPRRSAGPGKDRVKILESTKGDGKFDKITTVIDGLNIPSGIAIGHGGVWVVNSPDILFYPIEDFATPKLGKPQVVVTGFGRTDTHELPNSLTWGPDGWLYGLNGVFNYSHVKHKGKDYKFTCALFRIHPKTKDFEIFCEGTSNPWGLAINENSDFFVSACVIDHLWHLTETGYYHRQGGPYPPYTWKIGSIVKHRHQKAAYCGLVWFDSDAYPPEYREKLYMGNIHGNCINSDELARDGSTYFAKPRPDFLTANDAWFMPVAQQVGPDGCMYILDWYDRYHCYQDANRDPAGIDRLHGRLYRVVYSAGYAPAGRFDMQSETSADLIKRLRGKNIYERETAQRLLQEQCRRAVEQRIPTTPEYRAFGLMEDLQELALDESVPRKARLHALWAVGGANAFDEPFLLKLFGHKDEIFRAFGVRLAGNRRYLPDRAIHEKFLSLAIDPASAVQLQVAIAARKTMFVPQGTRAYKSTDYFPVLFDVLAHCGDDKLIPHIVWQNLQPLLEKEGERFLTLASKVDLVKAPGLAKVLPRAIDRIVDNPSGDPAKVFNFIDKLIARDPKSWTACVCMAALTARIQNGEITGPALEAFKKSAAPILNKLRDGNDRLPGQEWQAMLMSVSMGEEKSLPDVRIKFRNSQDKERLEALDALIAGHYKPLHECAEEVFARKGETIRSAMISKLAKVNEPWVAAIVLKHYAGFTPDEQAKSIELLTQRPNWAKTLFKEIAAKKISKDVVNINQARRLLAAKDAELARLVEKNWGVPRDSRNPQREQVVAQMKELYKKTPGDPKAGVAVFKKVCAQCHRIYGEGVDVGPDITSNGRSDFDQLLSNIFDPSLVIGAGYQAVTVVTKNGQAVSGLLVEDNPQRVVLKVQGGEIKTIARNDVDEQFTSKVSLMPEDLEKQLQPQEIVDLLSYLSLDRPPADPKSRKIPGTPR